MGMGLVWSLSNNTRSLSRVTGVAEDGRDLNWERIPLAEGLFGV